ncbi:uncharacterized protein HD556DRAFT_1447497 [Suillus plorans]|uniref:Uncharacterized protein n=1 Tax=Suillus plorans TaxID=116603 RepID=A0A9P7DDW9_9AGAM|nr:uncharacterized protein HD556DRAFT_1447497 [Suillus plorans]KAG1788844.1 hypothetical protein HD556DRAFT_1447497 [Suillus plorans]
MVVLYDNIEDLIAENDRRCEEGWEDSTADQNCLQHGYIALTQVLPWIHEKLAELDSDDTEDVLKKIKRGVDAAHGDNMSTLKDLVATWVNETFHPSHLLNSGDKQMRSFAHDTCGKLLCPAEWDWSKDCMKAGICNRTSDHIISENSWPLFVYENYSVNSRDLEQGLFRSNILVQAFKATFTSPSSAKEADVTVWQVCFSLSSVSSWHTIDGDFDYEVFCNNIIDFFEDIPGPVARHRVNTLLEWWTRKVFRTNHQEDLTPKVVSKMSVMALAEQRKALEDAAFDSD